MKHFISTIEWTNAELAGLLDETAELKAAKTRGGLEGKTMGMVFFNPSLRTRTSFEAGMFQLGGHAINLEVGQGMWSLETAEGVVMDQAAAEHVKEAAPVLSRYVDVLAVRSFGAGRDWVVDREDPVIKSFARYAEVPVINMESSLWHPCQALADAFTWKEQGVAPGDRIAITWAWHPKALPHAVPNSALTVAAQLGLNVTVLRPEPFALDPDVMAGAADIAAQTGGSVTETDDPGGLDGARIVYAKSWGSLQAYGRPEEESALREPFRDWQVTSEWMARTDKARFMHCLPVRRNVVVSDEVLDSGASIVVDQAENRMHTQNALLLRLLASEESS